MLQGEGTDKTSACSDIQGLVGLVKATQSEDFSKMMYVTLLAQNLCHVGPKEVKGQGVEIEDRAIALQLQD